MSAPRAALVGHACRRLLPDGVCSTRRVQHSTAPASTTLATATAAATAPYKSLMPLVSERPFDFSPYDCVGFDLDHTLCRYRLPTLLPMIYDECLAPFLSSTSPSLAASASSRSAAAAVRVSQLAAACLGQWPDGEAGDGAAAGRGLVFDAMHGNLVRLAADGRVLAARHGLLPLSSGQVARQYAGDSAMADLSRTLVDPPGGRLRVLRDFFDAPVATAVTRLVDAIDSDGGGDARALYAAVGERMRAALVHMYNRSNFTADDGGFFQRLRADTQRYAAACRPAVLDGLRQLRADGRLVFLLTSSNVDYAGHMARLALGERWRDYFDLVLTYACKPHFFSGRRPFLLVDADGGEGAAIAASQLRCGHVYSQGNWLDLYDALRRLSQRRAGGGGGGEDSAPRCLYVGDNLAFDVLPVVSYTRAHAVAVCEELEDTRCNVEPRQSAGTVFACDGHLTVWGSLASKAHACVPSVEHLFGGDTVIL